MRRIDSPSLQFIQRCLYRNLARNGLRGLDDVLDWVGFAIRVPGGVGFLFHRCLSGFVFLFLGKAMRATGGNCYPATILRDLRAATEHGVLLATERLANGSRSVMERSSRGARRIR